MPDYDHPFKDDPLVRAVLIDDEVETSPAIRVLMNKASQDAYEALQELIAANPHDTSLITRLQNRVQRFLDLARYIADITTTANAAHAEAVAIDHELPENEQPQ